MSARDGFGKLLRELRGDESVTAAAARLGVARQTLLDLESGRSNPTLNRIDRIASAYEVRFAVVVAEQSA